MFLNEDFDSDGDHNNNTQQAFQNDRKNNYQENDLNSQNQLFNKNSNKQSQNINNQFNQMNLGNNHTDVLNIDNLDDDNNNQGNSLNNQGSANNGGGRRQRKFGNKKATQDNTKIFERYEQRQKELSDMGGTLKQEKFQQNQTSYYDGINFDNEIKGQGIYEPGQKSKGINENLPTLKAQNTNFTYREEKKAEHLKLSDDSDNEPIRAPKQTSQKQESTNQGTLQISDESDDYEEELQGKNKKEMQQLKEEREKEEDAEIQVLNQEPLDKIQQLNSDMQELSDNEEQKQQSSNQHIIARPQGPGFSIGNDKRAFLTNPLPKGLMLQCTVKRDKGGMGIFYPKYHVELSGDGHVHIMSARKRSGMKTSNYFISSEKDKIDKKSPHIVGKVRSNFMGTEFHVFDNGKNPKDSKLQNEVRQELACLTYESNIMGSKGPRKMKVVLPKIDQNTQQPRVYKPQKENESIITNLRQNKIDEGLHYFENKAPKWNDVLQAFVLNFYGRVEKASVKNFQLIDTLQEYNDDTIFLQFGRVSDTEFNMDFQWPLSPVQAFGICISSFDYKFACE